MNEHISNVTIGFISKQPPSNVRLKFFENVGLKLGISVDMLQNFPALTGGRLFKKVSEIRGAHPAQPPSRTPVRRRDVPEQRFKVFPVPDLCRRPAPPRPPATQTPGVQRTNLPTIRSARQFDVKGTDQLGVGDVDKAMPEKVGAEQKLSTASLERPQIHRVPGEHDSRGLHGRHLPRRDENAPAAAVDDQPDNLG